MAYRNRFGITKIRSDRFDNLSINWDYDSNPDNVKHRYPVLLFTPDTKNTKEHYHIQLNKKQAKALHKWLDDHLNNKPTTHKKVKK